MFNKNLALDIGEVNTQSCDSHTPSKSSWLWILVHNGVLLVACCMIVVMEISCQIILMLWLMGVLVVDK